MACITQLSYADRRNDSKSDISVDLDEIGKILSLAQDNEIQCIANKMAELVSKHLILEHNPIGQFYACYCSDETLDAKSLFLREMPFEWDLTVEFQQGKYSFFTLGRVYEYSYNILLKFAARARPANILPELIGAELAKKDQYRLRFSLDLEKMQCLNKIVFVISQRDCGKEFFRARYVLKNGSVKRI